MCGDDDGVKVVGTIHTSHARQEDADSWCDKLREQFADLGRAKFGRDVELMRRGDEVRLRLLDAPSFGEIPGWYRRALASISPLDLSLTITCTDRGDAWIESIAVLRKIN